MRDVGLKDMSMEELRLALAAAERESDAESARFVGREARADLRRLRAEIARRKESA